VAGSKRSASVVCTALLADDIADGLGCTEATIGEAGARWGLASGPGSAEVGVILELLDAHATSSTMPRHGLSSVILSPKPRSCNAREGRPREYFIVCSKQRACQPGGRCGNGAVSSNCLGHRVRRQRRMRRKSPDPLSSVARRSAIQTAKKNTFPPLRINTRIVITTPTSRSGKQPRTPHPEPREPPKAITYGPASGQTQMGRTRPTSPIWSSR
jgi:hypothetical protein